VQVRRLDYVKGYGWWAIVLECGHTAAVLHGATSPLGEQCMCHQCDARRRQEEHVDTIEQTPEVRDV